MMQPTLVSVGMFVSCGRFEEEEIVYVIPNSKKSSKLINDVCDFVVLLMKNIQWT